MNTNQSSNASRPANGHLVELYGLPTGGGIGVRDVEDAAALIALLERQRDLVDGPPHRVVVDNSLQLASVTLQRYCLEQGIVLQMRPAKKGGR